jgi:hypothetical protein
MNVNATVDVDVVLDAGGGCVSSRTTSQTDIEPPVRLDAGVLAKPRRSDVKVNDQGGVHVQVHVNVDDQSGGKNGSRSPSASGSSAIASSVRATTGAIGARATSGCNTRGAAENS